MVFVGVHPTFTQVPPTYSRSTTAVRRPAPARSRASGFPAWPVPRTIASKRSGSMIMPRQQGRVVRLPRCLPAGSRSHFMRCSRGRTPLETRTRRSCMKGSAKPVGHRAVLPTHVRVGSDRPTPSSSTSPALPDTGRVAGEPKGPAWDGRSQPQTERRKLGISCLNPCHPGRSSAARMAPVWWHFPPFPKSPRLAKSSSHANPLLHEAKPPSRTPPERHLPYGESGEGRSRWRLPSTITGSP